MTQYVKNPKTGRFIKVDSAVYNALKKKGVHVDQLKRYYSNEISEMKTRRTPRKKSIKKRSKHKSKRNSKRKSSGRKRRRSPTRGWKRASPQRGTARHKMMEKCGAKCFLDPANEGFPICKKGSCNIDCRGVQSAYNRARQYHREDIASKARSHLLSNMCMK